jgi:hypothetical protein
MAFIAAVPAGSNDVTIQALAWAMDQAPPGTAKLVLQALANHADHTNGYVHFDAPTIAQEASIQVVSLWRYLGALERNGYLEKDERKPGDTDKRDYWLVLDRNPALPWSWSAQDIPESSDVAASEVAPAHATPSSANQISPRGFSRDRQTQARKAASDADAAARTNGVPVIEGSKAFLAWCAYLRRQRQVIPFTMSIQVDDGKWARGFYRPTLFPPRQDESQTVEDVA